MLTLINMIKKKLLSDFKNGTKVKILEVNCGREFSRRLSELGLLPREEIVIIKNDQFGPVIVKILESKIALGRGEARKIYAEEI